MTPSKQPPLNSERESPAHALDVSGLLLAGGKSTRMGRDKAELKRAGVPLWRRQLDCLSEAAVRDISISGRINGPWRGCGYQIIEDFQAECGPIIGIVSALRRLKTQWLLVLAVDLPQIRPSFLHLLLSKAMRTQRGVVPYDSAGCQPLAAIYPRSFLPTAERAIARRDFSMCTVVAEGIQEGILLRHVLDKTEEPMFFNVNNPSDWELIEGQTDAAINLQRSPCP